MGKAVKILLGIALIAVVAIGIVTTVLVKNLDGIIKQMIEEVGSQVTQTDVRVADVKFILQDGRGEIRGLSIASPAGYSVAQLFNMQEVAVELDISSLTGPVIVIKEVLIDGATLSAEQKGLKTNITEMLETMQAGAEGSATEPPPADTTGGESVRLALQQFRFINTAASIKTQQWGEQSLTIPDIKLNNLGDEATGLTPGELAGQMTAALVKQVEKAVTRHLEKLAKDAAKKEIDKQIDKNLSEEQKGQLDGLKSMFKKD